MPGLASLDTHLAAFSSCARAWQGRRLPLATPPGTRYPYVYPRDLGGASRTLLRLIRAKERSREAFEFLEGSAEFLLAVQRADGFWGQRYELSGTDTSIYKQEDNPAHGILVLLDHLEAAETLGAPVNRPRIIESAVRAFSHALKANFRPGINLIFSTTSVHESAIEEGYTLWTNSAHLAAGRRLLAALEGDTDHAAFTRRLAGHVDMLGKNMKRHFIQDGIFIRRLTPRGRYDRRPDVTLLSPFYFDIPDLGPEELLASANLVEKSLWDPDLGLLQRYLPFAEDPTIHIHGGNGPWMQYSAIFAQYHASIGNVEKAVDILAAISEHATEDGRIPEHLTTRERYLDYVQREWETGLDFEKEFDPAILLPHIDFSRIVEEVVHMRDEVKRCGEQADANGDHDSVLRFATPLMWSHAEFMGALLEIGIDRAEKMGLGQDGKASA